MRYPSIRNETDVMRYLLGVSTLILLVIAMIATDARDAYGQDIEVTMIVTKTDGQGARLRESPSTSSRVIVVIDEGSRVTAIGGELEGDGKLWRKVDDRSGNVGYVVLDYLADLTEVYAMPTATTAPTATPV